MARLTRAETQERNRAAVLAAARAEFAERGFRDAKIDAIAERAELTRGAVYSNFPGKRALYFAVLADDVPPAAFDATATTVRAALSAFARAWVSRLPLATDDTGAAARLAADLMTEVAADPAARTAFAQLKQLDAIVLGLALERLRPTGRGRQVRLAELALTVLHGAAQLAAAAPGFGEPFHVVRAVEDLPALDDTWLPPPAATSARAVDEAAPALPSTMDLLRAVPASPPRDGIVAVLGLHRLSTVEHAVRSGLPVTAVLVSGAPDELLPLVRLSLAELRHHLAHAAPLATWPDLQVICDPTPGADITETALRIADGRVVARADGWGACQAVASP
ncbi:TetR/AcrR family transcriptional regulator [Dactylosporangium aurantiacum]|uniref:TetR/AcrR family transcriptional regulator n=1 Tax=Dactylosporangium aurantiacum TaxID=35754 RepID=A0A9Q9IQT8_9ACTN|nr:TetR/AcrR family transcriptional regulator [Dactylosporangium aurantiacum]MDG6108492.1 TetR/AcrR family transcriptional regulator [Dactylosporangium aurantiacum]UWZ57328.1 TetR/AcrR family transcriptional regulator [Dactylosporangium aurantiacum]